MAILVSASITISYVGLVYGQSIMEWLAGHSHKMNVGMFYPIRHDLERDLISSLERSGRTVRRMRRATPECAAALSGARQKTLKLFGELFQSVNRAADA